MLLIYTVLVTSGSNCTYKKLVQQVRRPANHLIESWMHAAMSQFSTMTIPPGVDQDKPLVAVHVGGEGAWIPYRKTKVFTNCFIKQEGKVTSLGPTSIFVLTHIK